MLKAEIIPATGKVENGRIKASWDKKSQQKKSCNPK
jgi:hypothetical protein